MTPRPAPCDAVGLALEGLTDLLLGLLAAHPVGALNRLAGLEVLVDLEEVLDLQAVELRDVLDVGTPGGALVGAGHAQDLVVAALLIAHTEHAQSAAADDAAGEGRLLQQDQRVQGVAVLTEGPVDVAGVVGVARRGEEHAVQADPAGLVVDLVLVAVALGNLNRDVELHGEPPSLVSSARWALERRLVVGVDPAGRVLMALVWRTTAPEVGKRVLCTSVHGWQ